MSSNRYTFDNCQLFIRGAEQKAVDLPLFMIYIRAIGEDLTPRAPRRRVEGEFGRICYFMVYLLNSCAF